MESMRTRRLGGVCAEWFFSMRPQRSRSSLTVPCGPGPCQGAPANEEAEADALATSPCPSLRGNTRHKYAQKQIHTHTRHGYVHVNKHSRFNQRHNLLSNYKQNGSSTKAIITPKFDRSFDKCTTTTEHIRYVSVGFVLLLKCLITSLNP